MTAPALFDLELDEPAAPPGPDPARLAMLNEREEVYRWLCQRGWAIVPTGPNNTRRPIPAYVCASCGSVQANDYLMTSNGHTQPRDLVPDGAGGWLLRPPTPFGCNAIMHNRWSQFAIFLRRGDAGTFDAGWWQSSTLPRAPTLEAAEAMCAA